MEPQKEIEELEAGAYEMEKRLLVLKNAYAENVEQTREGGHTYSGGMAFALSRHKKIAVSPEDRYHMIAIKAYYRCKRDNFDPRSVVQHWIEAQAEIDQMLEGNEVEPPKPHHDSVLHGHE